MRHSRSPQGANATWWVAACTLLFAAATAPAPDATSTSSAHPAPAVELGSSEARLKQYRALRRMHAHSERHAHEGWLDAWTELDARGFRYHVVAERGSGAVRNRVLRAILEREQELIASGNARRGDLTAANYEFGPEVAADGLRYVPITAKRKDVLLVNGRMVLDAAGDLLRVEGVLAKNPSFWTTRVDVVRQYARVDGIRVPIGIQSTAKVRFIGPSHLNVRYEYEQINHRPVHPEALLSRTPAPCAAAVAEC